MEEMLPMGVRKNSKIISFFEELVRQIEKKFLLRKRLFKGSQPDLFSIKFSVCVVVDPVAKVDIQGVFF